MKIGNYEVMTKKETMDAVVKEFQVQKNITLRRTAELNHSIGILQDEMKNALKRIEVLENTLLALELRKIK